jgi:peptidoglycan/xylan/chitin deacetylase (PgdA/CDA1 family)
MIVHLNVGLSPSTPHDMRALLESLGLLLVPLDAQPDMRVHACIYTDTPSKHEEYIRSGGIAVTIGNSLLANPAQQVFIDTPFSSLDLGWLHDSALVVAHTPLQFDFTKLGAGGIVNLPATLIDKWRDTRLAHKVFATPGHGASYATEITTFIDKGNIQRTLLLAFQYAYRQRGLPFIIKSRFPLGVENVFCYRFDCDGGNADDVMSVIKRFATDGAHQAYFLNVSTYASRPDLVRAIETTGSSVDNHSYIHTVFTDTALERKNILLAHKWISRHGGMSPRGFVCPGYGFNPEAIHLLEGLGYRHYASFGKDYGVFPYKLTAQGTMWNMAYHPISLGRLLRGLGGFDRKAVSLYYAGVIERRLERGDPLFFYCHPEGRIAAHPEVYEDIRNTALSFATVRPISLMEYVNYLDARASFHADATFDTDTRAFSMTTPEAWKQAGVQPSLIGSTHSPLPITEKQELPDDAWELLAFECGIGDTLSVPPDEAQGIVTADVNDDWRLALRVRLPHTMRLLERLRGRG